MSQPPSNSLMYSTRVELTLSNWSPKITRSIITELFEHNQTAHVCDFIVHSDRKTATVVIDRWYNTENGHIALFAATFSKFFDVRVDGVTRCGFLLFTVDPTVQKQLQRKSGPPGLVRSMHKIDIC